MLIVCNIGCHMVIKEYTKCPNNVPYHQNVTGGGNILPCTINDYEMIGGKRNDVKTSSIIMSR